MLVMVPWKSDWRWYVCCEKEIEEWCCELEGYGESQKRPVKARSWHSLSETRLSAYVLWNSVDAGE